ncbi:MFS transporter [Burkholderia vietnamiensis]|uniref:MFS transporter n=1 Tax=Burkholderia vietnamiensis TaxID=60552 RepID=UPI001D1469EB|nr:MFS transporter [Burkholderia vietnamiensis]UEC01702.1 MFS transporter [Burkholderia vietnamiensis]
MDMELTADAASREREQLLKLLAFATFVVFFQAYAIAPMLPQLATFFHSGVRDVGFAVPAYLLPYGVATLFTGLLADRLGIGRVMLTSLALFIVLVFVTALCQTLDALVAVRAITGIAASGIVPLALVVVAKLFPYAERGRPLGWIFGAMAGGMALGAPLGVMLTTSIGWQGVMVVIAILASITFLILWQRRDWLERGMKMPSMRFGEIIAGYGKLLGTARGARTYGYVLVNSIFHSGVFTWLSVYLNQRYQLSAEHVGLALLGYGVPGLLLGPVIGRAADRFGRGRLLPIGLALGAVATFLLLFDVPLIWFIVPVLLLSLGYDMTQPLLAGIVTDVGKARPGQAMGLNVCTLFVGFGLGSLIFRQLLGAGFPLAFGVFSAVEIALAVLALVLFRSESSSK